MFTAYTSLDRCVGRELTVRFDGENYVGMLAGMYQTGGMTMLVITPMQGGGTEHHIPLAGAVVTVKQDR